MRFFHNLNFKSCDTATNTVTYCRNRRSPFVFRRACLRCLPNGNFSVLIEFLLSPITKELNWEVKSSSPEKPPTRSHGSLSSSPRQLDLGNNNEGQAENKKEEGNAFYKNKDYREALHLYTEAIELCPGSASYYGNRSACLIMLGRYEAALEDARQAIRLDINFVKGYLREAKCHLALGDATSAKRSLTKVQMLEPNSSMLDSELANVRQFSQFETEANNTFEKKDYRRVIFCVDRALQYASACTRLRLLKAECLAFLGRYQEAQEMANDLMRLDSKNADAIYVRGVSLYYQDNIDNAFTHFQHVLRLAPDHQKARDIYRRAKLLKSKKDRGNEAFKSQRMQEAYDLYTEALGIDPNNVFTNAKLYLNRAIVCSKINKLNQAVADCTDAIKLDENYVKAYLRRAKCYADMEMHDEAVRDYEKVCQLDKSRENKQYLQDAKRDLKRSKRKDYYKVLGIERKASDDEIRKAYRKRALAHHPDRHANATDDIKREQEKKFKELGEAYGVLSDPKKRSRYDNGHDLEDMDGLADMDPNNIFQTFFNRGGGGGMPSHFQFSTPNMQQGNGYQGASFPSGFTFQFT